MALSEYIKKYVGLNFQEPDLVSCETLCTSACFGAGRTELRWLDEFHLPGVAIVVLEVSHRSCGALVMSFGYLAYSSSVPKLTISSSHSNQCLGQIL